MYYYKILVAICVSTIIILVALLNRPAAVPASDAAIQHVRNAQYKIDHVLSNEESILTPHHLKNARADLALALEALND